MKSLMSQDSGIHHLHFTQSDIPLQSFSDFRKVSRSPIIRSIRLLAAHATVATCTLPAEHSVPSFTLLLLPPPQICSERNYVTSKTETETVNRYWPLPKPKNRFYRGNPVLETLVIHTLLQLPPNLVVYRVQVRTVAPYHFSCSALLIKTWSSAEKNFVYCLR